MLTKLQITLCVLAGVAIVVFFAAIITNAQVKSFENVPSWQPLVVWASFGLIIVCSIGVIVTEVLEFREPKEKKEEPAAEGEMIADESAERATAGSESLSGEGAASSAAGNVEATTGEPAAAGDLHSEVATTEELASDFDFTSDFADFEEEK